MTPETSQLLTIVLGIAAVLLAVWNIYLTVKLSKASQTPQVRFLPTKSKSKSSSLKRTTVNIPPNEARTINDFTNKVILVTGGTSGIGLATAIAFAAAGAQAVVVCGRTLQNWQSAQTVIKEAGFTKSKIIEYVQCDVRVESQVQNMIQGIFTKYGKLDVAVNNAGVANGAPIQQQTLSGSEFATGINYNLQTQPPCATGTEGAESPLCENPIFTDGIGVLYCLKHEVGMMRKFNSKQSPGCIVNTASVNSFLGSPGGAIYSAAKAMVKLLTQSVAAEQAQINPPIRVNCVAPGAVFTPLITSQFPKGTSYQTINQAASVGVPLGRIAQPSEIAEAILFLADDLRASYITGSMLIVDGGLTAV